MQFGSETACLRCLRTSKLSFICSALVVLKPLHISEPGQLFSNKSPASQWPLVPNQHLPGSATISSETLATESRHSTLCNTSPAPSQSDRRISTESIASRARIVSLKGTAMEQDAERLALEYGLPSQMGLLDPSYSIFINEQRSGGVSALMAEFRLYRRRKRWGVSFLGAGKGLVEYSASAKEGTSTILQFGHNRVLNPLTNEVIHETSGKRILTQNRQLLNPSKGGLSLDIYSPSAQGTDYRLEWELSAIYHDWCIARNATKKPQAFITE
ncbi:protein ergS [Aspergillus foveolatus]|uniref:protein ergS n=1 Tax=Aspergillus foveolatus TaxID=210207 RepID=UPI003CCD2262